MSITDLIATYEQRATEALDAAEVHFAAHPPNYTGASTATATAETYERVVGELRELAADGGAS